MTQEQYKQHKREAKDAINDIVEKHGWYVVLIDGTDYSPSFAYTVGLWKTFNHPEIISFGLDTAKLATALNAASKRIAAEEVINTSLDYYDLFEDHRTQFVDVHAGNLKDYFGYALLHNDHSPFPALQLVWTDGSNKFPWDAEESVFTQPLLDRNVDFKFREAKDMLAYTSKQWLEQDQPILQVVHDVDGVWLFLTGDETPEDIEPVALELLVLRDKTLNDVFDLEYGESAGREAIGGQWRRIKIEVDVE